MPETYDLSLKRRPGLELKYRCKTEVLQVIRNEEGETGRQSAGWETSLSSLALAVEEDDSTHSVHTSEPVQVSEKAKDLGLVLSRSIAYDHVDRRGRIHASTSGGTQTLYLLPDMDVALGDTWEASVQIQVPFLQHVVDCPHHYRLAGLSTVDGRECLDIEFHSEVTHTDMPLPSGDTFTLDLSTRGSFAFAWQEGVLARLELRLQSVPTLGDTAYETITDITQELVSARVRPGLKATLGA